MMSDSADIVTACQHEMIVTTKHQRPEHREKKDQVTKPRALPNQVSGNQWQQNYHDEDVSVLPTIHENVETHVRRRMRHRHHRMQCDEADTHPSQHSHEWLAERLHLRR